MARFLHPFAHAWLLRQNRTLCAAPSNTTEAAVDKEYDYHNSKLLLAFNETVLPRRLIHSIIKKIPKDL
jgi:hypothetical protein